MSLSGDCPLGEERPIGDSTRTEADDAITTAAADAYRRPATTEPEAKTSTEQASPPKPLNPKVEDIHQNSSTSSPYETCGSGNYRLHPLTIGGDQVVMQNGPPPHINPERDGEEGKRRLDQADGGGKDKAADKSLPDAFLQRNIDRFADEIVKYQRVPADLKSALRNLSFSDAEPLIQRVDDSISRRYGNSDVGLSYAVTIPDKQPQAEVKNYRLSVEGTGVKGDEDSRAHIVAKPESERSALSRFAEDAAGRIAKSGKLPDILKDYLDNGRDPEQGEKLVSMVNGRLAGLNDGHRIDTFQPTELGKKNGEVYKVPTGERVYVLSDRSSSNKDKFSVRNDAAERRKTDEHIEKAYGVTGKGERDGIDAPLTPQQQIEKDYGVHLQYILGGRKAGDSRPQWQAYMKPEDPNYKEGIIAEASSLKELKERLEERKRRQQR